MVGPSKFDAEVLVPERPPPFFRNPSSVQDIMALRMFLPSPNSEASKSLEFNSTNTRFEMYLVVLELLFMSLTYTDIIFGLGMGFDLIPDDIINDLNNPHNGYLSILGRYGVFGLALFLFFCWYGIKKCFIVFKNRDSSDWFLPIIFISFVSDGFFQTSLDSPHTLVIFYLAASSLMGAYIEKTTN